MKKIIAFLTLLFALTTNAFAMTATELVSNAADQIMDQVINPKISLKERQDHFKQIFVAHTNLRKIAKFTLGSLSKQLDDKKLKEFEEAFLHSIVVTWTERFLQYAGEKFVFTKEVVEKDTFVYSTMDVPDTEKDIDITWRVNTNKQGEMKIVDIIAEGVSMLQSYRDDYTNFLRQNNNDIDALIKKLYTRVEKK